MIFIHENCRWTDSKKINENFNFTLENTVIFSRPTDRINGYSKNAMLCVL